MKDLKFYTCNYCYEEYIPKRRGVQKYCSNSCRSNACRVRNQAENKSKGLMASSPKIANNKKDEMSLAGVGNAAAGILLANTLKTVFTKEDNKPATKGDLKLLTEKLNGRYHLVKNMPPIENGANPYFDLVNNEIVYLFL